MKFLGLLQLFTCSFALGEDWILRARFPAPSPDARAVAFCYHGDIWRANVSDGRANRLTSTRAEESMPFWSPDGNWIAFTSNREGSQDVYVMSSIGGPARRLTYDSGTELCAGWTPDSKHVLFQSTRFGGSDIYRIRLEGGTPIRITRDDGRWEYFGQVSPDGKKLVFVMGASSGNWRNIRQNSSNNGDIYVSDFAPGMPNLHRLTRHSGYDLWPMWSKDGKYIYFVSDRGSPKNLWRMSAQGDEVKKLTNYTSDGVRYARISADGSAIFFEYDSKCFAYEISSGKVSELKFIAPSDDAESDFVQATRKSGITSYALSPDGKRLAFILNGDVYWTDAAKGGISRRLTSTPQRESDIFWLSDSMKVAYLSGRLGSRDIFCSDLSGEETQLTSTPEDEYAPELTPDGKSIIFIRGATELRKMDVDGANDSLLVKGSFIQGLGLSSKPYAVSSDSKWLAYETEDENYATNIYIAPLDGSAEPKKVTRFSKNLGGTRWSKDGKLIVFECDQAENSDIYAIDLMPKPIEFDEDALDKLAEGKKDEKKEEKKDEKPAEKKDESVRIDFDNITDRVRALTSEDSNEGSPLVSADGKTVFFLRDSQIWSVPAEGGAPKSLTTGSPKSAISLSPDGTKLFYLTSAQLKYIPTAGGNESSINIDAEVSYSRRSILTESLYEAWWVLDRFYYDPAHHGADWNAVWTKYSKTLPYIASTEEMHQVALEMCGELNSSHTGISGGETFSASGLQSGYLGIEFDDTLLDSSGQYRVRRILRSSPAALCDPKVKVGDYVVSLDGIVLTREVNIDQLLLGKVGKRVILQVNDKPLPEGAKPVKLKPISSAALSGLMYEDFVKSRRELTEKYSGAKLGYLHIQGMDQVSLAKFKREVQTESLGKEGLIIDVRNNGGGSTAQDILGVLQRKPFVMRQRPHMPRISEDIYRGYALQKPSILLTNENSFSNAEIFSEGFKTLKLGKVVGVPTAGGVIGTGSFVLVDGSVLRLPAIGAWTIEGENLEGKGRPVDVYVEADPYEQDLGEDTQLKRAVEELLKNAK